MKHVQHLARLSLVLSLPIELLPAQDRRTAHRPNIIFVMADDLGWGDTGFNGNQVIQTPHLDQMAKSGLRFERFYSGAPVCSPTRGSSLTGRHPYRYGIWSANQGHLRKNEVTLAEALKTQGYTTGHFGKWHLGTLDLVRTIKGENRNAARNFLTPAMSGFDEWFASDNGPEGDNGDNGTYRSVRDHNLIYDGRIDAVYDRKPADWMSQRLYATVGARTGRNNVFTNAEVRTNHPTIVDFNSAQNVIRLRVYFSSGDTAENTGFDRPVADSASGITTGFMPTVSKSPVLEESEISRSLGCRNLSGRAFSILAGHTLRLRQQRCTVRRQNRWQRTD